MSLRACKRKSGFSNEEWISFTSIIRKHLTDPVNSIGLEGIKVHKDAWEAWFDNFLDHEIGKQYWGILKGKKWVFPRDRYLIGKLLRTVVVLIAKRKRQSLLHRLPTQGAIEETGKHPPAKESLEEEVRGALEEGEDEEDGEEGAATKGSEGLDGSEPGINTYPMTQTSSFSQGASPLSMAPRPPLIFSTRLVSDKNSEIAYKFVYTEDSPSLSLFLEKVYRKHKLAIGLKICVLRVKIGNKTFTIDLNSSERHWDWSVVMEITRKEDGPVEIILAVSQAPRYMDHNGGEPCSS